MGFDLSHGAGYPLDLRISSSTSARVS